MSEGGLAVRRSRDDPGGRDRVHGDSLAGRGRAERQQGRERRAAALRRCALERAAARLRASGCSRCAITASTDDGVVVIKAQQFRSQEQNKAAALERLAELVRRALFVPKVRRKTKPTRASQARRLDSKARTRRLKRGRRTLDD